MAEIPLRQKLGQMFSGILSVNMDAKGRLAIPTRFRDGLLPDDSPCIAMTIDPSARNLVIYPFAYWEQIQAQISNLPTLDPHASRLQQLVLGHAFSDLELDASGRILVPPLLREYAQFDKKLVLVGQPNKVNIWSESLWNAHSERLFSQQVDRAEMSEEMLAIRL